MNRSPKNGILAQLGPTEDLSNELDGTQLSDLLKFSQTDSRQDGQPMMDKHNLWRTLRANNWMAFSDRTDTYSYWERTPRTSQDGSSRKIEDE